MSFRFSPDFVAVVVVASSFLPSPLLLCFASSSSFSFFPSMPFVK